MRPPPPQSLSDLLISHPDIAEALAAREQEDTVPSIELTPELSAQLKELESLKKREHALETRRREIESLERATLLRASFRRLSASCVPFKIGGRDGIAPSESAALRWDPEDGLDIVVVECGTPAAPRQLAWIPVPLWPVAKPGKPWTRPDGTSVPTADLGEISITDSLSTALVYIPQLNEKNELKRAPVSLRAFARVSISSLTPTESARLRERREQKSLFESVGDVSDNDSEVDGAATSASMDERPFIPSEVKPTQRESRPSSRNSPFSLDGDKQ